LSCRESGGAQELTRQLTEDYPAHSFVICADEARRLGLPVRDITEYPGWETAVRLQRLREKTHDDLVGSFAIDELEKLVASGQTQAAGEGQDET